MTELVADYVILGGGTAGCVLAARLSEDPSVSVLLLEAGGSDDQLPIRMPMGMAELIMPGPMNWGFETGAEPHLGGRRLSCPRGRVLGGCSSINGMVYVRGHKRDYDDWAARGAAGWSYADVLPFFRKAERHVEGPRDGGTGPAPLAVQRPSVIHPLDRAFLAAGQSLGWRSDTDFNAAEPEGFGVYGQTIAQGRRVSTATAYLGPIRGRSNLRVITGAHVLVIQIEARRATGAEVLIEGVRQHVKARKEVILAAGAIQSPQILQLSGLGDPAHLARIGVGVKHVLPGVGRGLKNHPDCWVQYRARQPVSLLRYAYHPRKAMVGLRWLIRHDGIAATNHWHVGAFLRTRANLPEPDAQFMLSHYATRPGSFDLQPWHGFQLHMGLQKPASSGHVLAATPDPLAAPDILFNYFADSADRATAIEGLKLARRIIEAPAFDALRGEETYPGPEVASDAEISDWLTKGLDTAYHPTSTCRMGTASDVHAVTDPEARVHGIAGLRVVDASIMPDIVNSNPHAAVIMIAEKVAAMISATKGQTHVSRNTA